jgi:3-hydroxy-9,10-secoandrosta-1,3,5(10)-triene-9,17-dione monooxygenase reductase component
MTDELKLMIGKALGRIPSGVHILTTGRGAETMAMMASWVQQASFDPPAVTVAVAKGRPAATAIHQNQRFVLSILAEGDKEILKKYARGIAPGEDPFAGVATIETAVGTPALGNCLAYMECELLTTCDFYGDHELFIGKVIGAKVLREGGAFVHLRGNGFHY